MRVLRAEGVTSGLYTAGLTRGGPQQLVAILDARDDRVRPGDTDRPDTLTLYLATEAQIDRYPEGNIAGHAGREIARIGTDTGSLVRNVVVDFDPLPGEILIAQLDSGYIDEASSWKFRILLDGLGTVPLIVSPSNPGELIEGELGDGSFISPIALDIHHIDAELEAETRGIQTVGVTVQFDGETRYMIVGSGQLLDKNITTGETHLLARVTSFVEFPVDLNYFPDANIEADFRRDLAGLPLDITDMMLTKDGAVFGFETFMPAELGGFFIERGAFSAPDGRMLVTRTGIAGDPTIKGTDKTNARLFDRFNADLSDIEIAYGEAADTLTFAPEIALKNFIANGVDLPLSFSSGGGFVVENGEGRLEGSLSAIGSPRIGPDFFNLTLEGMKLDLSDPVNVTLATGAAIDFGFGFSTHLPLVEATIGVTADFALDELVLAFPTLPDLPVLPPWLLLTSATIGAYGLAPGGAAPRLAVEAEMSFLPDIPLPGPLGELVDLGQISLSLQAGTEGLQGTGQAGFGTMGGGSLITINTAAVLDAAGRELTLIGSAGLGLPVLGNGAVVNAFRFTAGVGSSSMQATLTFATPENIAWALGFAGLSDPFSLTLGMQGRFTQWGNLRDQYIEGTINLGIAGFEVEFGARMRMDGDIDFYGYDLTDLPEFVEGDAGARSATRRQGMEAREGQDLAMRTVGETDGVALIGPDGTVRRLEDLEADATDGITVLRDAAGASIFIADATAGRWAIEAAGGNGFLSIEEQQGLELSSRLIADRSGRRLEVTIAPPDGVEPGYGRLEVLRARDAAGTDAEFAGAFLVGPGTQEIGLESLDLPPGDWTLLLRATLDGLLPADDVLAVPAPLGPQGTPDRGIVAMRWVPIELVEDGAATTYGLEITLREFSRAIEPGMTAQLILGGEAIGEGGLFALPGVAAGRTLTFLADLGREVAAPLPGDDVRATLTLMDSGRDANLANNTATATLYTTRDGVTANLVLGTMADETLRGLSGADLVKGFGGADRLLGQAGDDTLVGGAGADRLDGGIGADSLVGGADNDTYLVDAGGDVVLEAPGGGDDRVLAARSWTLGAELERLGLTGTADLNGTGNALDNRLDGNAGANRLAGGDGNDSVDGGAGADTLLGEGGNDRMVGGLGADSMAGGIGDDTYLVEDWGDVVVELPAAGHDRVIASISAVVGDAVERLSLSGTADLAGTGNVLANRLDGNAGANLLDGGEGNDTVFGGAGEDTLLGGAGADRLHGGLGADSMAGGAGDDIFRFLSAEEADGDAITDFSVADGDRLDLRPIDANQFSAGDQAFAWIGDMGFSGVAGELRFAGGILEGDVDGDGTANFQIGLNGTASLTAASLWL
jgi:Ca2+-binding RTX toxin-like protein